jgi:hypothetical protein
MPCNLLDRKCCKLNPKKLPIKIINIDRSLRRSSTGRTKDAMIKGQRGITRKKFLARVRR